MLRYSFLYVSFLIVSTACAPKETNHTATTDLDKKDKNSEKATTNSLRAGARFCNNFQLLIYQLA
jgi:hypothetical protein